MKVNRFMVYEQDLGRTEREWEPTDETLHRTKVEARAVAIKRRRGNYMRTKIVPVTINEPD